MIKLRWTKKELDFMHKYYVDMSNADIAKELHRTLQSVMTKGRRLKLRKRGIIDLIGVRFGQLVVVARSENGRHKNIRYLCRCDCGDMHTVNRGALTSKRTMSCGCTLSYGEHKIAQWLLRHDIKFNTEHTFDGCKDKNKLRFDFYISNYGLIEYQGRQHYKPVDFSGHNNNHNAQQNLKNIQRRDNIKRQYCKDHNIKLLEIPYTEFENIHHILRMEIGI